MIPRFWIITILIICFSLTSVLFAQSKLERRISDSLTVIANTSILSDTINNVKMKVDHSNATITVTASEKLGYLPFRKENVHRIYHAVSDILGETYPHYSINVQVYDKNIEDLIPIYMSDKIDSSRLFINPPLTSPLVTNTSLPYTIEQGLINRNIALWNSHGRYFNQDQQSWTWQRPRMFLTVEDLLTTSFVLPFLVPMLENAGAQVYIPRERDIQINEVVVDNDNRNGSWYRELSHGYLWKNYNQGFSNEKEYYLYGENPFEMGTSRQILTTTYSDEISYAEWIPNIPERGRYAVYVSYQTLINSTEDAHYTIHHAGGKTSFKVNQTIFGGTWLYLGHFQFDEGRNQHGKVVLTNFSQDKNRFLTADAVKFGGGKGNIAVIPTLNKATVDTLPIVSNFPRYTEGSKYWLQWAGFPDSIYSRTHNENEYSDDFQSRGFWVNHLVGSSVISPDSAGLGIPLDLSLAFHTDAGRKTNDSIVGTLGICAVGVNNSSAIFENGVSKWASRDLTDLIQTEIVNDIRKTYHPMWTRRGIWNKSYSEARVPKIPTMLLELLSHQNFEDMKFAHDPRFRFMVSRAIYKAIVKHFSLLDGNSYVVQPLPVEQFSCEFTANNRVQLSWKAVNDSLAPSATAKEFILYTRIDDGGFDNGRIIKKEQVELEIMPGYIYSFKVEAVNQGGASFPSEILSVFRHKNNKETMLIINGFDRVSGPEHFNLRGTIAGFLTDRDAGVPYLYDLNFTGEQYEYAVEAPFESNENPGFGASKGDFEHTVIAGNTFDYPYLHGKSIKAAGYSFTSSSKKAVTNGNVNIQNYKVVNLILGKQKETMSGIVKKTTEFKTFPLVLQQKINAYCQQGGNIMVSGSYVASDMNNDSTDSMFLNTIFKTNIQEKDTVILGGVVYNSSNPQYFSSKVSFNYFNVPNPNMYAVDRPDIIQPTDSNAFVFCTFEGSNYGAGIAYKGKHKSCVLSVPFETIKEERARDKLMEDVLHFFFH